MSYSRPIEDLQDVLISAARDALVGALAELGYDGQVETVIDEQDPDIETKWENALGGPGLAIALLVDHEFAAPVTNYTLRVRIETNNKQHQDVFGLNAKSTEQWAKWAGALCASLDLQEFGTIRLTGIPFLGQRPEGTEVWEATIHTQSVTALV